MKSNFKYQEALLIANKYLNLLKPFCERIEIAGSLRRKCKLVGDIELVVIPKKVKCITSLFNEVEYKVYENFKTIINSLKKVKGEPDGKYTQRILPEGITLDLFIVNENNWGLIYAIRTGSQRFSHKILATGWSKLGYESKGGILYKGEKKYCIREEIDLFNLINLKYIEPELRV